MPLVSFQSHDPFTVYLYQAHSLKFIQLRQKELKFTHSLLSVLHTTVISFHHEALPVCNVIKRSKALKEKAQQQQKICQNTMTCGTSYKFGLGINLKLLKVP